MKKFTLLCCVGLLAACGAQQNTAVKSSPDDKVEEVAFPPKPSDARALVMSYLNSSLKDPDSLKDFSITEPRKGRFYGGMFNGFRKEPAWYVCYTYNAKNSYGGYVGTKRYVQFFEGDVAKSIPMLDVQENKMFQEYYC